MNTNHFDCFVSYDDGPKWHFSAVYGFPESVNKKFTWELLNRLVDVSPLDPWLLIGDLNEIFSHSHKNGGPLRHDNQMAAFRITLDRCFLQDFPFEGDEFTWAKNRKNPAALKERLDWCLINKKWTDAFILPKLTHLDYFDAECVEIVSTNWLLQTECDLPSNLQLNLQNVAVNLQQWHSQKFGQLKNDISQAQSRVQCINSSPATDLLHSHNLTTAESILDELLAKEEQYWQQRSRIEWLKSGDRNTKFFHAKASARNSTNKIKSLKDANGNLVTNCEGITNIISHYFQDLFTASEEDHWALSHVLSTILTTINDDQNDFLLRDFTKEDVYFTLKSMASDKSPGLDGMSAMFYHHHWHIVGNLVSSVVLHILNDNGDPTIFNKTLLTLIPKVKKPTTMKDFRPISLCNVVYKLVSKMIIYRFKYVLPLVISETQSAFLPNRLITDNVLVAFEMIHSLKHRKHGNKGYAAIKLDMSKAFDRVEWSFLAAVMGKMGFNIRWISLIMRCLHTTSFSFNLNGSVVGSITPQRGLRQGDPLSPYLFLICSEGLSRLLQYEERVGRLKGYAVSRRAPTISHLFFADDSLLFCQADDRSCGSIKRALNIYHRASGQELNLDKSVMSFSPNTPPLVQHSFQNILGMPISDCHEKYLGLPAYSERDKKQLFADIKERIWKLMNSWNDKLFSIGRKEHVAFVRMPRSRLSMLCSYANMLKKSGVWLEQLYSWQTRPLTNTNLGQTAAYYCNFQQHSTSPNSIKDSTGAAAHPKWLCPPLDKLKMNVDAACDVSRNKIGVGIIIQNSSGQVVAANSKLLTGRYKPQEMEAKALILGIDCAALCNLSVNLLESDSLILVNSINSNSNAISSFGDLVLDIKNRLSYLSSVCVSHVKQDANQAAHGLAKDALELDDDCMWFEEIPSTIFSVAVNDAL
ncbi:uncharacterized protein LOC115713245 [Cannabis sativa]|uniref:uncharacterized protein LOC115713245 n=1 Tax=Cannabis sativa TaxID=3483 RepID=UPI0029CA31B6|nr:uncharacterized protein LOC115713245 [Cannabis sativa]